MKNKKVTYLIILLTLGLILFSFYRVTNKPSEYSKTYFALGTVNEVKIYGVKKSKGENILDKCELILRDIENKMSAKISSSEVNKINDASGKSYVKVSDETFWVIKEAVQYAKISDGHFDPTIGPLSNLWDIGTDKAKVPAKTEIDNLLPLISYKNVLLDDKNSSVKLSKTEMKLDLGGIAKGYAADEIAKYLRSEGVEKAIVNLGGNIYVIGTKENESKFNIGLQDPNKEDGNSIGSVKAKDTSVVTSGIYERFIKKDGKLYHHILSPFDGYPYDNELSGVTIISNKSINCDALSTSVFGLGLERGLKLINNLDDVDAIFITKDKKIYLSNGAKNKFNLTNKDYTIVK
jgi:thiamine biosynthesis lipoprotein